MNQPADQPVASSPSARIWQARLFEPCDIASVVFFRIAFAGIMLCHVGLFIGRRYVNDIFVVPPHHLSYFGFEWVRPLPGDGMWIVYYLMGVAAIGVGLGLFYRLSAVLLFVTYTYSFLAEAALFQNHYYMMSLVAFLLILIPAHRSLSLDAINVQPRAGIFIPNWCRWALMFLVALPYVYGGIAKLNADWLHAMPVGAWVSEKSDLPLIGPYLTERWAARTISYAGLVFDLTIVPLLLWSRTRRCAYAAVVVFHLLNAVLFDIDVFPWMMILATPILFSPDWPRRLLKLPPLDVSAAPTFSSPTGAQRVSIGVLCLFVAWQLLFPLRHWAYPGDPSWTEEGQQFAWRMMLRRKEVFVRFYATDNTQRTTVEVPIERLLTPRQIMEVAVSPDQLVAIAPFLAERARSAGLQNVSIRAVVIASLNGRKPQLLIDPDLDLLTLQRTWGHQPWIVPLTEPLRSEPWDVSSHLWPEELGIELPSTTFLPSAMTPNPTPHRDEQPPHPR